MPTYRRNFIPGATYFFTVNLLDRTSTLLTTGIDALRAAFRYTRQRHPFEINAIVVLPEHLHTIWTLPPDDNDFATRWRLIKGHFSRNIPAGEAISSSRSGKGERALCQRRYWEHTIRDDEDFERHVDYIHFNPVKHGLAGAARDWEYSSFHRYVEKGVLPADWGGYRDAAEERFGERG